MEHTRQGVPSFPVQELHLLLYIQPLSESTESKAAVEEAVHALSWLHGLAGLQPLVGPSLVLKVYLRRFKAHFGQARRNLEAAGSAPSLTEVRLLAFAGFMHCDELIHVSLDVTSNAETCTW